MSRLRSRVATLKAYRDKAKDFIVSPPGETAEDALRRDGVPPEQWERTMVVVIPVSRRARRRPTRAPSATRPDLSDKRIGSRLRAIYP